MTSQITARITRRDSRSGSGRPVEIIELKMPEDFIFRAGQYLEVVIGEFKLPLSIASAPKRLPLLNLHYRSTPGVPEAARMDSTLECASHLNLNGPFGDVRVDTSRPLIVVAGGTGAAQALSLIEASIHDRTPAPVLFVGLVDTAIDHYINNLLPDTSQLEMVLIDDDRRGPKNRGLTWIADHMDRFRDPEVQIVLAGGPPFVHAATEVLMAAGVSQAKLQSDVYAYHPGEQPRD